MKEYLVIKNAKQVLTLKGFSRRPKIRDEMKDLGIIENGTVVCRKGKIAAIGEKIDIKKYNAKNAEIIDAANKVVMPGFIDCHTHLVFAGNRAGEFVEKIKGTPYLEILAKGGGIISTVNKTRTALENDWNGLKKDCLKLLKQALSSGTTTMEIKSGYGLDLKHELAMLKMVRELAAAQPVELIPTLLGAHVIPPGISREDYVELVLKMISAAKKERLAEFCDVFCEEKAFTPEETEKILKQAKKSGLMLKLHASQFNDLGAVEIGIKLGATSIDHLENISDASIKLMAGSGTVGVLLPGCEFHLMTKNYAPARKMIEAGVPLALATDFNPGSSPILPMPVITALACRELKMTPEEAISAVTINASHALGRSKETGSLETGKKADVIILDIADYRELPYWLGMNPVSRIVKAGKLIP